jgi:predicted metalloprotease with PDZ domain
MGRLVGLAGLLALCAGVCAEDAQPFLGIRLRELSPEVAAEIEVTATEGLIVVGTHVGGPARLAGVLPFDLLLEVNGQPTATQEQFRAAMAPLEVGNEVPLRLTRKGEIVDLKPRLVSRTDWAAEWLLDGKPLPELAISAWNTKGPASVEELRGSVSVLIFWYLT